MFYPFRGLKFFFLMIPATAIIPAAASGQIATHLVISQVYGGGGNSPSLYANDFVELYNPTSSAVSLTGWSIQYALGLTSTWLVGNLSGTVNANSYFLIGMGSTNATVGQALPTPDITFTTNMGSVSFKVGLVNSTTVLTGTNPSASCVDFVGTGTANGFEGAGAAPAGTNSLSLLRLANATATAASMAAGGADANAGNGYDAGNNAADFVAESVILARNSSTVVLPVVFTDMRAFQQESGIQVDWTVAGEIGIVQYIVQKSTDGIRFDDAGSIKVIARDQRTAYDWTDETPASGSKSYYRIKAVELSGNELYSIVVQIATGTGKSGIVLYPNPVFGQTLILAFDNEPKGAYMVNLFNAAGQNVYNRVIEHTGGSATQQLSINALTVKGFYRIRISDGKNVTSQTVISR